MAKLMGFPKKNFISVLIKNMHTPITIKVDFHYLCNN